MRIIDIIIKKRDGVELSGAEISAVVNAAAQGSASDEQLAAFLMAVCVRGMTARESAALTKAMAESGEVATWPSVAGIKIDKHSTGGVGDGTSLVVAPIAAAAGVKVPMMSGRGLGHTGGTLDKLEAIPGFRTNLTLAEAEEGLKKIGAVMMSQTKTLAPADRKLYAIRDVTGTVESIPLITASILSKKWAEGADALVLDVKFGSGAFMRERAQALALAQSLQKSWQALGRKMTVLLTAMEEPLGQAVGNALEVKQAVQILQGAQNAANESFIELCDHLAGWMIFLGGRAASAAAGKKRAAELRGNGLALKKWGEMIKFQGGKLEICDDPEKFLPTAKCKRAVAATRRGKVLGFEARQIGIAAIALGAGRNLQTDVIDPAAGIWLHKKTGDAVEHGEILAELFAASPDKLDAAEKTFVDGVRIGSGRAKTSPLIWKILESN